MKIPTGLFKAMFFPLLCLLIFLFLCLFRLPDTYAVNGDMARDSLESLRILREKKITFIGPPLSLGQLGTQVTYFSSAIYYLGAFGLAISRLSILGPAVLISIINASALFPLSITVKQKHSDSFIQLLAMLMYVTNPIVVMYSRLFWNPSPLIGLGVWGVFLVGWSPILFGLVSAIAVYFHYFALALFLYGVVYYLHRKQWRNSIVSFSTWIVCLSPFIVFEIRNKFYLTLSFWNNLQGSGGNLVSTWQEKLQFFLEMPLHLFGLLQDPFAERLLLVGSLSMWSGLGIWLIIFAKNKKNVYFYFFSIVAFMTALSSHTYVRIQYVFIAIGALWMFKSAVSKSLTKSLIVACVLLQTINTTYAITRPVHVAKNEPFLTISQLENVADYIVQTHQSGKAVNVTENIRGDARAQYLRFFLEKKQLPDLRNELDYQHLDELYVLTPSIEKTYRENRWEFTAGGATELDQVYSVGQWQVLTFRKPSIK